MTKPVGFYTDEQGRKRPITPSSGKRIVIPPKPPVPQKSIENQHKVPEEKKY
ncbi:MAG: hypothetical protein QXQ64_08360 [Candidatus Bathyarchaeia archaeon]